MSSELPSSNSANSYASKILRFYDYKKSEHENDFNDLKSIKVKCLYCSSVIKGSSIQISGWKTHIRNRHPDIYMFYRNEQQNVLLKQNLSFKILNYYDFRPYDQHAFYLNNRNENFALKCLSCGNFLRASLANTSNWVAHLKLKHIDIFRLYKNYRSNTADTKIFKQEKSEDNLEMDDQQKESNSNEMEDEDLLNSDSNNQSNCYSQPSKSNELTYSDADNSELLDKITHLESENSNLKIINSYLELKVVDLASKLSFEMKEKDRIINELNKAMLQAKNSQNLK